MLDAHGVSFILPIEVLIIDTAETYSVKALLNCRAMDSFINKNFV